MKLTSISPELTKAMVYDQQLNELWQTNDLLAEQLIRFQPSIHLSSIVEQYFVVDKITSRAAPVYILPDLSGHLLLYQLKGMKGDQFRFSFVGSRTAGFRINRHRRIRTFIIRFRPGIVSNLTQILGKESCNQSFTMASLFPAITDQLTTFLSQKMTPENNDKELFQWLEKHFLEPLQGNLQLPRIFRGFLAHLQSEDIGLNVKTSAKHLGISERYLHKLTTFHLGINPNKALRIGRLMHSFENRMKHPQYNWSDIAFLSGYADQSHMIEEYQALLTRTPGQLQSSLRIN